MTCCFNLQHVSRRSSDWYFAATLDAGRPSITRRIYSLKFQPFYLVNWVARYGCNWPRAMVEVPLSSGDHLRGLLDFPGIEHKLPTYIQAYPFIC